jgi:hypothetical protein
MAASKATDQAMEAGRARAQAPQPGFRASGVARRGMLRALAARLVIAAVCLEGSAWAQDDAQQKAAAEALFDEGRDLVGQGQYEAACRRFEQSQAIDPGVGTLLYLGDCYERVGRLASAWAMYREASSAAQASGQAERSQVAFERARRLTPNLSKLAVMNAVENRVDGFEVVINDKHLSPALFGVAFPVDAGRYRLLASAPGHVSWSALIEIKAGGDQQLVQIPALPLASVPAAARTVASAAHAGATTGLPVASGAAAGGAASGVSPVSSAVPPAATAPGAPGADAGFSLGGQRTAALIVAGGGVLALGAGVAFGVNAKSQDDDAKPYCPTDCFTREAAALNADARTSALIANVSYGVGLAALAAGAVLYFTGADHEPASSGALSVAPEIGAGRGLLRMSGEF